MKDTGITRITFVRHGDVHNPENLIYGRLPDFPLSSIGRLQVAQTAQALVDEPLPAPSKIYTSPQERAQESARIIRVRYPELEIVTAPLIDEIDVYFEGHPAEVVAARGWDLYTDVEPGYDTPEMVGARGAQFVAQMREIHAGQHVLAVTHGDVIAFTILQVMQQPVQVAFKRTLDRFGIDDLYPATASLTTLVYTTGSPNEIPGLVYERPYDEELIRPSLS
jgi:broad specificity phosphatase PhoE